MSAIAGHSRSRPGLARRWRAFVARRPPWLALLTVVVVLAMALAPDLLARHDPNVQSLGTRFVPPFWLEGGRLDYPLGTDGLGRDILSRIVHGTRISLIVAVLALLVGGVIGGGLGLISGYAGGWVDAVLMRLADSMLAFPMILLAFLLAVTVGASLGTVVVAVALVIWARFARVVRGEVLSLRERNFVKLARIAGCGTPRILWVHILPNVINTIVVLLTLQLGWVIIVESSLSFLGAGIPPPTPAWGSMIADGRSSLVRAWWVCTMPGIALMLTVLSFNLIGDWLRDVFDPKLRQD
ncbi:MAG: ABC transporter permease [Reyranellaceae bacterium]